MYVCVGILSVHYPSFACLFYQYQVTYKESVYIMCERDREGGRGRERGRERERERGREGGREGEREREKEREGERKRERKY